MMKKQSGAAMVEFAIIALVFFTVIFGLIESARLFFTANTLTEMARRGARFATVCPPNDPKIIKETLFNNPTSGSTVTSSILPFINTTSTTNSVRVRYLDASGCYITALDSYIPPAALASATFDSIKYVSVQIINYTHNFIFPPMSIPLGSSTTINHCVTENVRIFAETVLPRESLGVVCIGVSCATVDTNNCGTI